MNKHVLYVRNRAQKELFENYLQGQISDGMWENDDTDERLWDCKVKVASKRGILGCTFKAIHPIDFCDYDLLDWGTDRMIEVVKRVRKNYTEDNLIADLQDLTKIVFGGRI